MGPHASAPQHRSSNDGGMQGQQPDATIGPLQLRRQLMGRKHSGTLQTGASPELPSLAASVESDASALPRLVSPEHAMTARMAAARAIRVRGARSGVMLFRVYSLSRAGRSTKERVARLVYTDEGRGEAVVFLHAFPLDGRMWAAQARELSPSRRVIVPDFAGFGGSTNVAPRTSLDEHADDVAALLDALEIERATIAGLSMGG